VERFDLQKIGYVGLGVLVIAAILLWNFLFNIPSPTLSELSITAEQGFETVFIGSAESGGGGKHHNTRYHQPRTVKFKTTSGPVELYIAPVSLSGPKANGEQHAKMKREFVSGQIPKEVIAQASGKNGQLALAQRDVRGMLHYLIMVRSPTANQVTLEVHYGR
jgi:hypothetical protein